MAREAFRDEGVVSLSQQFVCILVDVREEPRAANSFGVVATPTVSVLMPGSQTQQCMEGVVDPKMLVEQMQRILQMSESLASQKRI